MKNNIIKYLACAAMALGLAATVQGAVISGGVTFTGGYAPVPTGTDLSLATTLNISGTPAFAITGSGTFAGNQLGNLVSFNTVYNVHIGSGGLLSPLPANQTMWQLNIGAIQYFFTVTSELQTWTPQVGGGGVLNMSGNGNFTDSNGDTATGSYQIGWGTSTGLVGTFQGTSDVNQPTVPDGGTTVMLLGMALSGLAFLRRKLA